LVDINVYLERSIKKTVWFFIPNTHTFQLECVSNNVIDLKSRFPMDNMARNTILLFSARCKNKGKGGFNQGRIWGSGYKNNILN